MIVISEDVEQPILFSRKFNELNVVISGLALGGAERIVLDWAERIYPKWRVHIIVLRDNEKEWPVPDFIRVTRLYNKMVTEKLTQLGRVIAKSSNPVCVCHLLKKFERDILSDQGVITIPVLHNAKAGWLEASDSLSGSPYTICVSRSCDNDLRQNGWKGFSSIINHIPRARKFSEDTRQFFRKQWNIPSDATVIGMIGAIKPQKNYSFALQVLKEIHKTRDAYLVILGGPIGRHGKAEWQKVFAEVNRLDLRHRVAMPGFIFDAIKCLPAFDVMLNTSHYEGLSIATLEALVNKMSVVASRVGGQGEIDDDGLYLVNNGSSLDIWSKNIQEALDTKMIKPSWTNFTSYKLWTLAQIARPVKKSKKVLFVTANLNSGGAQRSLVNLTKSLAHKLDFEIAVTGNSTSDYFFKDLNRARIRVFKTTDSRDVFDHSEILVQKICSEDFGTVCFWNLDPKVKLLLVKALGFTGVNFVDVSPGNYAYDEMAEVSRFQKLICFDDDDYYERLDKLILKYDGFCPKQCMDKKVIIRNGVVKPVKIKEDYSIGDAPRIVVNGRIAPSKFLVEIIQAVKILHKEIPKAQLHIFGAAEARCSDYAKEVASAACGDNRIVFHGLNFEAVNNLAEFDAYIVLGKNQGCPNALLEALSVGLPAIANNDGGTREQLIHNQTGLLINNCSPEELYIALFRILKDRQLAKQLGENGRIHIENFFSMEQMTKKYLQTFKEDKCISIKDNFIVFIKSLFQFFKFNKKLKEAKA